jgi:hypothetical protein
MSSVGRGEFRVGTVSGTVATLIGIGVGVRTTKMEINAKAEDSRLERSFEASRGVSTQVGKVVGLLESQQGMYVEMELCLGAKKAVPDKCWSRRYEFDAAESGRACLRRRKSGLLSLERTIIRGSTSSSISGWLARRR